MESKNSLITRVMTKDGSARLILIDSTEIVRSARKYHNTSKTVTAALGRCLTITSMMGCLLKDKDNTVTLKFNGDGPAGAITCTADYTGDVRGYAENPDAELPPNSIGKLDVGGAIGKGTIYVIKDMGMGEPYVGLSPIITGEVAEDMTNYFASSEQTPTICALGVRLDTEINCTAAGGFLLQLMPGYDNAVVDQLEMNMKGLDSVSSMMIKGYSTEDIINAVLKNIEYDIFDSIEVSYRCNCSKEKYKKALLSLGKKELVEMYDEGKDIETQCRFCGGKYIFTKEEIKELIDSLEEDNKEQ